MSPLCVTTKLKKTSGLNISYISSCCAFISVPQQLMCIRSTSTKLQRRQHKTTYRLIVIQLLVFPKCVVGVSVCFQCCCFGANVEFVYALMRHQFLCPPTRVCLIWMRRVSPTFPSEYCRVCLSRLFAQNSNRQPDINNNHWGKRAVNDFICISFQFGADITAEMTTSTAGDDNLGLFWSRVTNKKIALATDVRGPLNSQG